ncbi:glycoside hydrolase 3 domain-containing protein [Flammeovirgaceae bacterium 311]|nr:glycoside hydrolase 3 domain-containing protein [Flammeovirgaceae bacterium 311]
MMKRILAVAAATFLSAHACVAQTPVPATEKVVHPFTLEDFYRQDKLLDQQVEQIFGRMSDEQRAGQMIIPAAGRLGKTDAQLDELARKGWMGGVILLNGTVESFKNYVHRFDSISKANGHLPLVYSADAEPSLINRKIGGSTPVPKTAELKDTAEVMAVAHTIAHQLKEIGILYNYAPVTDLSLQNAAIGNRSFGSDPAHVERMNRVFITTSQADGVATTAKHFPGHGLVKGDSHKKLVFIDGPMQEVDVYKGLIQAGVLSIMIGHIAVQNNPKYNTDGQPATLSRAIVTDLLKNEMGFKGIITTDAMNMGAVAAIPNSSLKAAQAGNDIILMPNNEKEAVFSILAQMDKDAAFKQQVYDSVKKIIRFKLALGVIR